MCRVTAASISAQPRSAFKRLQSPLTPPPSSKRSDGRSSKKPKGATPKSPPAHSPQPAASPDATPDAAAAGDRIIVRSSTATWTIGSVFDLTEDQYVKVRLQVVLATGCLLSRSCYVYATAHEQLALSVLRSEGGRMPAHSSCTTATCALS